MKASFLSDGSTTMSLLPIDSNENGVLPFSYELITITEKVVATFIPIGTFEIVESSEMFFYNFGFRSF